MAATAILVGLIRQHQILWLQQKENRIWLFSGPEACCRQTPVPGWSVEENMKSNILLILAASLCTVGGWVGGPAVIRTLCINSWP